MTTSNDLFSVVTGDIFHWGEAAKAAWSMMRAMRGLLRILGFVTLTALACRNQIPEATPKVALFESNIVFEGKVKRIESIKRDKDSFESLRITFQTIKLWKGKNKEPIVVYTTPTSCDRFGHSVSEGDTCVVFAKKNPSSELLTSGNSPSVCSSFNPKKFAIVKAAL